MSANGTRTIIWAGGEDVFCLAKVGLILDLEERCKAGIAMIMARIDSGIFGLNDIREPIRLGLIGGGMAPDKAMARVRNHVDENPLAHSVLVAQAILQAVLIGVPGDAVGKPSDDEPGKAAPPAAQNTGSSTTTAGFEDPK
jgi:hypothetical protein